MRAAAVVEEAVRSGGLLSRPVLVLLSGGRDSVCLLDLAVRISGEVRALHVDYGLRPSSRADAALCRQLCARLGVPLEVRHAGPPSGNVQAWARDVRYRAARDLAGDDDVAAGHTATDQVETVLYRLAASPGRRALTGMPAVGNVPLRAGAGEGGGARLVRPLLAAGVSREETGAYCVERGLPFADDPTNDSGAYARNRVRHDLLEALRSIHPAAEANVLRTLGVLRDEAEVLDALVESVRTDDVARLRGLPPALARLLLGPRAQEILALDSGALDLGSGERAVIEHGRVRITRDPPPSAPAPARLEIPGETSFGAGRITARSRLTFLRHHNLDLDARAGGAGAVLDAAALAPALTVRAWEPGDRMRPLGLGGSKSLQDLFTDRKVPRESRRTVPVVVSGEEIAWVPGVAIGERFQVTAATRERVNLSWHP